MLKLLGASSKPTLRFLSIFEDLKALVTLALLLTVPQSDIDGPRRLLSTSPDFFMIKTPTSRNLGMVLPPAALTSPTGRCVHLNLDPSFPSSFKVGHLHARLYPQRLNVREFGR